MNKIILSIDLGGHGRIIAFDLQGNIVTTRTHTSDYITDYDYIAGVSFSTTGWKKKFLDIIADVMTELRNVEVAAIITTSQRQGIVVLGEDGRAMASYPNVDMRGVEYMETFDWDKIHDETLLTKLPLYSAQKLYAFFKKQPECRKKAMALTSISGWMNYVLTGELAFEKSHVISTALYNIYTQTWSDSLCDIFNVPVRILPPIKKEGEILGTVTEEVATSTGLKAGTPVIVGGADTQAAIAGIGAEKNDIVMVNGTTTPIMTVVDKPVSGSWWMSPGMLDVPYLLEDNAATTGTNVDVLCEQLYDKNEAEAAFAYAAEQFENGAFPPVTAVFSQNLHSGENFLQNGGFFMGAAVGKDVKNKDYLYALILNVAFQIKEGVDVVNNNTNGKGRLIGVGGGFSSDIEAQVIADLTGRDVILHTVAKQASAYGCFLVCCRALKIEPPALRIQKIYHPRDNEKLKAYYGQWKKYKSLLLSL